MNTDVADKIAAAPTQAPVRRGDHGGPGQAGPTSY